MLNRPDESGKRGRLAQSVASLTSGLSFDAVVVIVAATVLIILFHEDCSSAVFRGNFMKYFSSSEFSDLYPAFYWYGCSLLVLGILPALLGKLVLGFPARELGMGLGDWKFGLKAAFGLYFAFLPILVLVSYMPSFQSKYPLFAAASRSGTHFLVYECAYAVYFIGWEFVFRGFMLFGLRPSIGYYAVFVQMIPFAILHFGKAQIETLAAVFAGILLGYLALRARSFWYGWLLHTLVATSNDVLAMLHKHWL